MMTGIAYAEEATIDVPFDYDGTGCTLYGYDTYFSYNCYWVGDKVNSPIIEADENGNLPDCTTLGLVYDPEFDRCITPEQLHKEAIEQHQFLQESLQEEIEKLTPEEKKLIELRQSPFTQDQRYADLIEQLGAYCFQGVGRTAAFQPEFSWPVATEMYIDPETGEEKQRLAEYKTISADNLRNHYGELRKAVEWCKAQDTLENGNTISDVDKHLAFMDKFDFVYHGNMASHIAPISAEQVENAGNEDFEEPRYAKICYSFNSDRTKQMYGCPVPIPTTGDLPPPPMKDYGKTDPYKQWFAYMENPDANLDRINETNTAKFLRDINNIGGNYQPPE
jgi:hypothetical protein